MLGHQVPLNYAPPQGRWTRWSKFIVPYYVIEDDPSVCDALVALLRAAGEVAIGYPDAEAFFRAEPPGPDDTIIVDLLLPGVSGSRVITWLQAPRHTGRMIVITGQSQSDIETQTKGLVNVQIFRKPLSAETVASII
jgi:FixJ family two-component response regulator